MAGDQVKAMIALSDACDLLLTPHRTVNDTDISPPRFGDSIWRSHSVNDLLHGGTIGTGMTPPEGYL